MVSEGQVSGIETPKAQSDIRVNFNFKKFSYCFFERETKGEKREGHTHTQGWEGEINLLFNPFMHSLVALTN